LRGVIRPPLLPKLAVGVGQSFAALDKPQPEFLLAPGML
jgi:hypothetical protein